MKLKYLKNGVLSLRSRIDFVKADMVKLGVKNFKSVKYMNNPLDYEKMKFLSYLSENTDLSNLPKNQENEIFLKDIENLKEF